MRNLWITFLFLAASALTVVAQNGVSITTDNTPPDGSAIFDIKSTTRGMLVPRMTQAQRNAIATPATGLLIYQTDLTAGFYYYDGTVWIPIAGSVSAGWGLTGNAGTVDGTNFIGTTDDVALNFKVNNTMVGRIGNSTQQGTFFGYQAGLSGPTIGQTAFGYNALRLTSTGVANTAIGRQALELNVVGNGNTALGASALTNNTGSRNTALGQSAGSVNTTGSDNTFLGQNANPSANNLSNATAIGRNAVVNASNKVRLGNDLVTATDAAGLLTYNVQSATTSVTLPNGRGTNGQVLTTDGAGLTSWSSAAGEATTANNGLTLTGLNVALGGDLTATTNINQDNAEVLRINNNSTVGTVIDLQNTGDFRVLDNGVSALQVLDNGNLTVGTTNQFQVNNAGDITRIHNIVTSFPTVQGTVGQVLTNDGAGTLSWTTAGGEATTVNNGLTLTGLNVALGGDLTATTTITQDAAEALRINNNATAGTIIDLQNTGDLRVLDNGTNAFQVLDDGRVIIGTASQMSINNTGNITRLNNVVTNFPNAQGAAGTLLGNDGAGNLDWVAAPTFTDATTASNGATLTGNDVRLGGALTASTTITQDNAEVLRIDNNGTANTIIDLQNTGDFRVLNAGVNGLQVLDDGRVLIGTANQLSINNVGNITRINNVVTSFPAAQGAAGTVLNNDGAGNLTWAVPATPADATTASNGLTLTGNDVRLGGTLTTNTTVTQAAALALSFNNNSTAATTINLQNTGDFLVQDNGTNALTVQDNGTVTMGSTGQMQIDNSGNFSRINNLPTNFPTVQGVPGTFLRNDGSGNLAWAPAAFGGWFTTGNTGTVAGTNFMGNIDDIALEFRVNNQRAGYIGNTLGSNAFFGHLAGFTNSSGDGNTGIGKNALGGNSTGTGNTAVGNGAAISNVIASANTAIGQSAMINNQNASRNTVVGESAMFSFNFANGGTAYNSHNTAIGRASLYFLNATTNANGVDNTALGVHSGLNATTNVGCTYIGTSTNDAVPGYVNGTVLGYNTTLDASNRVRIGGSGVTSVGGPVAYTNFSDQRFKHNVSKEVMGLNLIMKLQPVTYQFDYQALDRFYNRPDSMINRVDYSAANDMRQIGFMAQEIDSLCQVMGFDFGAVDKPSDTNSGIYGLRYTAFVPVLVKAVQEQQVEIAALTAQNQVATAENAALKAKFDAMEAKMAELEAMKAEILQIKQALPIMQVSNH